VDLWGRATRKGGVRGERNGKWRDGRGKRENGERKVSPTVIFIFELLI